MLDYGFGRCDGHHEMVDLSSEISPAADGKLGESELRPLPGDFARAATVLWNISRKLAF
jgi:hypothetical protein